MIQYLKNIRSPRSTKAEYTIWNTGKYSRVARWESRESIIRRLEERGSGQATANPRSRCDTLIRHSKAATVDTLGSDMRIQGCQKVTRQVHMIKPVGVLRQSHVYMIKWCGSCIPVQAMTSNIKKIEGTRVNPQSIKYMYINKSESENMHRKRYGEHRYT